MLIPAIIRETGGVYKTGLAQGLKLLEIHIWKSNSEGLPYKIGERVTITILINSVSYLAGVRATQDCDYIWISPDLKSAEETDIKLAYILKAEGFHKNQFVYLEVIGDGIIRLLPSSYIIITLAPGCFNQNYVRFPKEYLGFFPPDSIGGSNEEQAGKLFSIHVEGLDKEIQTDIDGIKKQFRKRCWQEFFDHHNLNVGDEVVIEKLADYEYKIYPKSKDKLVSKEQNIAEYLKADEAELSEIDEAPNEATYSPTTIDNRQIAMKQIRIRRGQHQFRQILAKRYGKQCLITGCHLFDIIEAAHISPYRGDEDNHPENGLLLRADLHTLFDLDLLGIEPTSLQVHFHPTALEAGYSKWKDKKLCCFTAKPSQKALELRWEGFVKRLQEQ
jgi:hypothetical protein